MAFPASRAATRSTTRRKPAGCSGRRAPVFTGRESAWFIRSARASSRVEWACYAYAGTTAKRAAETLSVLAELKRMPTDDRREVNAKIGFKAHLLMDQESTDRARELLDDIYFLNRVVPVSGDERIDAVSC